MEVGKINLGLSKGDAVDIFFDERNSVFIFQGHLPNGYVWLKVMRMYAAIEKQEFSSALSNAATFAGTLNNNRLGAKYGFEIHIHAYYINKILPKMLEVKHDYGEGIRRANEYEQTLRTMEKAVLRAQTAATDTQGAPHIGKAYAADYQAAKADYEALSKEWQEILEKYRAEAQELNRLATNANAAIFTVSICSDVLLAPDGTSAVQLALNECLTELEMRCKTVLADVGFQHFDFRAVKQPFFFFMSELAGMFNPVVMAYMAAQNELFANMFAAMFPSINAASALQSNLPNMRHLSSYAPADLIRKMLMQMEYAVPTAMPPPIATQQGAAQTSHEPPPRSDNLLEGELIGHDKYNRPVKIDFPNLDSHILIEGFTGRGKSTFARLLASIAIEKYGMTVIACDISYHWSVLVKRYNGVIFDKWLNMDAAMQHPFSLCVGEKNNIEGIETNFLKLFYEHIKRTRGLKARKRKDILLIVDEAHNFGKRLKRGALVDIIAELGKYGIIVMLISQRKEYVGIDARSQASLLLTNH